MRRRVRVVGYAKMWNMMCDVMPTIAEDSISQRSSQYSGEDANFEQLMVSMLDERDKLVESLRESQERLQDTEARLQEVEKERDCLNRQLNANIPQVCALLFQSFLWFTCEFGYEFGISMKRCIYDETLGKSVYRWTLFYS